MSKMSRLRNLKYPLRHCVPVNISCLGLLFTESLAIVPIHRACLVTICVALVFIL